MGLRILSLDGGGYRGRLTALMLHELQKAIDAACHSQGITSKRLIDCFDLIAGTSTGSLIAASLALGKSTKDILEIYDKDGELLFPRQGLLDLLARALSRPIFDGSNLESVLRKHLGDIQLGKLEKAILITTYDPWNNRPLVLRSYDPSCRNIKLFDACRGSSAYPGAFPAHRLRQGLDGADPYFEKLKEERSYFSFDHSCDGRDGIPLIDGGLGANNPALLALADYKGPELQTWLTTHSSSNDQSDKPILASFGTGQKPPGINFKAGRGFGMKRWVGFLGDPLLETMFVSYSNVSNQICRAQLGDNNFYRFQPVLLSDNLENLEKRNNVALINKDEAQAFGKATFQATKEVDELFDRICDEYFYVNSRPSEIKPCDLLTQLANQLVQGC